MKYQISLILGQFPEKFEYTIEYGSSHKRHKLRDLLATSQLLDYPSHTFDCISTFFPTGGISCKSMWQVRKYVFLNKREIRSQEVHISLKVLHPMYSKHWPYILAYTMYCDWRKILNHGLFLSFFNFFLQKFIHLLICTRV
jgi:hypothetical protein